MWVRIVSVWLLIMLSFSFVHAANEGPLIQPNPTTNNPPQTTGGPLSGGQTLDQLAQNAVDLRVSEANRYLSAEVSRQMADSEKRLLDALIANNDENFRIFDDRMKQYMADLKMKVMIGGMGVLLLVNALIGLAYLYVTRRYSYEHYLEKKLDQHIANAQAVAQKTSDMEAEQLRRLNEVNVTTQERGLESMQQPDWGVQSREQSMSTMFGQTAASKMTDMNQWQFQPAYDGAWKRAEQPISYVQYEAQQQNPNPQYPQYPQPTPTDQPDYVHPYEDRQQQYRNEGYNGGY